MTEKRWKQIERYIAELLGSPYRRPTSGSHDHHADGGTDDIVHPLLYVEVKHMSRPPGGALWKKTIKQAKQQKKTPVVYIHQKGQDLSDGHLWVRPKDLLEVALCYEVACDIKAKQQLMEEACPKVIIPTFVERLTITLQRIHPIIELLGEVDMRDAIAQHLRARAAARAAEAIKAPVTTYTGAWAARFVTCSTCSTSFRAEKDDDPCPVCGNTSKTWKGA